MARILPLGTNITPKYPAGRGTARRPRPSRNFRRGLLIRGGKIIFGVRIVKKSVIALNPFRDRLALCIRLHGIECFLAETFFLHDRDTHLALNYSLTPLFPA